MHTRMRTHVLWFSCISLTPWHVPCLVNGNCTGKQGDIPPPVQSHGQCHMAITMPCLAVYHSASGSGLGGLDLCVAVFHHFAYLLFTVYWAGLGCRFPGEIRPHGHGPRVSGILFGT